MLISEFSDRISGSSAKVSKVNQHWFPKWIRRFSTFVDELPGGIDAVNFEAVVKFSQQLRDTGIPAVNKCCVPCSVLWAIYHRSPRSGSQYRPSCQN